MAHSEFHLQFEDFEDKTGLMNSGDGATTVNIGDESLSKAQKQRRAAGGSSYEEDNDPPEGDDKTELLRGEKKSAAFWTLEYYQKFFDVDTYQVVNRIISSLLPWRGKNFVRLHLRNNPDLYGPFWICATLVFTIGVCGNLSNFIANMGQKEYKYVPEFRKVTIAATTIYSYAWLVPLALWGVLTWRSAKISNAVSYSFLEIVCVYGYSLSIYIPAVMLWMIHNEILRWASIAVALCLSGSVLVLTFWPVIRNDRPQVSIAVISTIIVFHVLLTIGCKVYFFSYGRPDDHTDQVKQNTSKGVTNG